MEDGRREATLSSVLEWTGYNLRIPNSLTPSDRPPALRKKILFQDLSRDGEGPMTQRSIAPAAVERALAMTAESPLSGFAATATRDEIAANGFDLRVTQYVAREAQTAQSFSTEFTALNVAIAERNAAEEQALNLLHEIAQLRSMS
jgi:type I restriction-modification system DNA methylase subunit